MYEIQQAINEYSSTSVYALFDGKDNVFFCFKLIELEMRYYPSKKEFVPTSFMNPTDDWFNYDVWVQESHCDSDGVVRLNDREFSEMLSIVWRAARACQQID